MRPGCRGAIPACYIESRSGGVSRITPTSIGVSCGYDRCTVNIQSNIRWSVTSSVSWIFPLTMGGTGDGTTELGIMENFEQQRSGVVAILGTTSSGEEIVRRIDVTQAWCKRRPTRVYIKKRRSPDCLFGGVACDEQTDSRLLFHILYETLRVCSSYRERLVLDGRFRGYSVELCVSGRVGHRVCLAGSRCKHYF